MSDRPAYDEAVTWSLNPWRLQARLGHNRIDETMRYVHVAEAHHREVPEIVLGARGSVVELWKFVAAACSDDGSVVGTAAIVAA